MKKIVAIIVVILVLLGAGLYGSKVYNQMQAKTIPEIQSQSITDYATNIGNALLKNGKVEIPDELLTGIVQSESGASISLMTTPENTIKIFSVQELPLIKTADITAEFSLEEYKKDDESIKLSLENIYIGTYKVPKIFVKNLLKDLDYGELNFDGTTLIVNTISYELEILGSKLSIGIDSLTIESGKLYSKFYADTEIKLFG